MVSLLPLLLLEFVYHCDTPFMMDDLWYSTNLATGRPLQGIGDVLESQIWHYQNWGGRSMTHALLQLVLMTGPMIADVINLLVTLLLAYMCSIFIKKEQRGFSFALASSLLIAFNPNIQYSMFWQSGSVNYLYSTVWILGFMYVYISSIDTEREFPGITLWIIPLGLITGWSNENMGPASFCLALMTVLYLWKKKGLRPKLWMIEGMAASLVGSALCILAPGNFVRSQFAEESSFTEMIKARFISMLTGGCSFLFPSFLMFAFLFSVWHFGLKKEFEAEEMILFITAVLAYGAMLLSPHFPDRSAFGIMILNNVLSIKLLTKICDEHEGFYRFAALFYGATLIHGILLLVIRIF